jgi:hypothetical protein
MKLVERNKAIRYETRAVSFFRGMNRLADDMRTYGHAVGLLAVHAAISLADAVLVACKGQRSVDQDHRSVLDPLEALCNERRRRVQGEGTKHLRWLLGMKTDFAYGDDSVAMVKYFPMAKDHVARFFGWAYRSFPELSLKEAGHDKG